MFWAACTLAASLASFVPDQHLGVSDMAIDSQMAPSCLRLHIKASKTDPFHKGCYVHISRGDYPLCAIHALMAYLSIKKQCRVVSFPSC